MVQFQFVVSFSLNNIHRFMGRLACSFPLQVAIGALVLYGVTLSHGVTTDSLSLTAKVAGWDWRPMLGQPLLWLFTLPIRLLAARWVPLGLNCFSAASAALSLGLLARTIQLMSWGRPLENTPRRAGKLPVLLACVMCGLEFSFWQDATAATGEMLDLLLLAASLWLLLEYRVRQKSPWLDAAAFVWGLGMAENWLMLLALPLFVLGVIWLQIDGTRANKPYEVPLFLAMMIWLETFRLFQAKIFLRLAVFGLAGFSIYALLPLINGLGPHSMWDPRQSWLASLKQTKTLVEFPYFHFWRVNRLLTMVVMLYFLAPALLCMVRFPDEGAWDKSRAERFHILVYRGLRASLLLAFLWLAFDPVAGPRQILQSQFGVSLPLLTFDYLIALGVGFLVGNPLLISPAVVPMPAGSPFKIRWQHLVVPFVAGCLVMTTAGLAARNSPAILRSNLNPLQGFGELAVASLPAGRGVMLSEQPEKLEAFQAALSQYPQHSNQSDWLAVDTDALPDVAYRAWLERRQPMGWLTGENRHYLTPLELTRLLEQIAHKERLFYLHPSYGWFFERFYLEPAGAIYEMKMRGKNSLENSPLPRATADANEIFWTGAWQKQLAPLAAAASQRPTSWPGKKRRFGLTPAPCYQDHLLAEWYSLSLDGWGVTLQQQGRWPDARLRFEQALQLNPDNISARINLVCNTNLQSGFKPGLRLVDEVAGRLGDFQHLSLLMNKFGPFDEPNYCYLLGLAFQKNGQLLQAAEQFERVRTLAPGAFAPEFSLAELYIQLWLPDRARPLVSHLRDEVDNLPANDPVDSEFGLLESKFWLSQSNITMAHGALESVLQRHSDDTQIVNRVLGGYLDSGGFTNALQLVNTQLSKSPDDVANLNIQAAILIQSGHATAAIPVLDHVLMLTNLPAARLNRAIARFNSHDFAGAQTDYDELKKNGAEAGPVAYGLAALADQRHDTNQAVNYLRLCLSNTPAQTPLWRKASARLLVLEYNHGAGHFSPK